MTRAALLLILLAAGTAPAGCAAPACTPDRGPAPDAAPDISCVPSFGPDGRLRRDPATDAPLFEASAAAVSARAPRFNDDGTCCRDAETGDLLYDDVSGGEVVRVLFHPGR